MQMRDGRDGDQCAFDNEKYAEREALDNGSSEFPRHTRKAQGRRPPPPA